MRYLKLLAHMTAMACMAFSSVAVTAQTYPAKPVRMIVPYAPGGAPDVLARSMGIKLGESLGQPFVVDNRPSAGGMGAADMAAHSSPDGLTVFFSDIQQLAINPYLFKKLPPCSAFRGWAQPSSQACRKVMQKTSGTTW